MQPSRRTFVTGLAAPLILGAANKSGSANPVVGTGAHTYEVIQDWGELPQDIQYGNTHGVCEDSQGHIYVHHTVNKASQSHNAMVVFDHDGKFVSSWGPEYMGGAHGLHIHKEGREEFLYLCDTKRATVAKTTLKGEQVWSVGYPELSEAYEPGADGKIKYSPTNLAIAPNGDIYVGDGYGSSYINQRSEEHTSELQSQFRISYAVLLNCPHGIIVDTRGRQPILTVADRGNNRIQRFTLDGKHLDFVDGTNMPCHFHIFKNGDTVVPDLAARVTILDRNNKVIEHLGDDSSTEWRKTRVMTRDKFTPGKFVAPHGACFDHKGNIFIVEWVEVGRVTKLRRV